MQDKSFYHNCIYCKENKHRSLFTREHVLQEAFGLYGTQTMTLINIVCKDCNSSFGEKIDRTLARDTIEGLARFRFGVKNINNEFREEYKKNIRLIIYGFLKGLEVIVIPLDGKLSIIPYKKDIGLRKTDGTYDFFDSEKISDKTLCKKTYPLHLDRIIILPVDNSIRVKQTLADRWGINDYKIPDYSNVEFDTLIERTASLEHMRAIAKIAFNYLAYLYKNNIQILLNPSFDLIRNFIKNGEGKFYDFIKVSNETSEQGNLHYITMEMKHDKAIVANVSLFTYYNYKIILTPYFPVFIPGLNSKSIFNNDIKKIDTTKSSILILQPA